MRGAVERIEEYRRNHRNAQQQHHRQIPQAQGLQRRVWDLAWSGPCREVGERQHNGSDCQAKASRDFLDEGVGGEEHTFRATARLQLGLFDQI